ncbi:hypothetical protein NEMBOFW57_005836 [Staphylotrichum longicolle]|uniref:G-protein coupled receptor n=1 Tax=Staphylotrichum longicolle TaxID=669026 RepID=A0AAD4EY13_9PEZI|nr:hypothetical protein NEMBOFW57_005836 [Staphylotrichum longicolle]
MDVNTGLQNSQIDVVSILERTCSVFSLLGSVMVITTFSISKAFHKPINRLVFYASFGNLMTNVATLMARSFINNVNSAGCQFQAFLIQMFMPADAFWTLSMAVNVYLTFYFKFDAQRLRRMEIPYLILCYGTPFIVALVLIFISTPEKGRMYGNATLWCWIAPTWDIYRIAIFYGPVWIVILITFFIYIRAGREIYKKHKQLREFSTSHNDPEPLRPVDDLFSSTKTTEVFVTSEVIDKHGTIDLAPLGERRRSQALAPPQKPPKAAYSVTISSNRNRQSHHPDTPPGAYHLETAITADSQASTAAAAAAAAGSTSTTTPNLTRIATNSTSMHTRTAPTITNTSTSGGGGGTNPNPLRRRAAYEANNATWSYTKCALLFFTAMLVTWIPSSANRVYSFIHSGQASLPLEYMSSFVLPLQGFWNAIIYFVTSWGACRMLWDDVRLWCGSPSFRGRRGRRSGRVDPHELMPGGGGGGGDGLVGHHLPRGGGGGPSAFQQMMMMGAGGKRGGSKGSDGKAYETESMTELAGSRPESSSGSSRR